MGAQSPQARRPRARLRVLLPVLALAVLAVGAGVAMLAAQRTGVSPRQLGPYVERRASGHNRFITGFGHWLGPRLVALDRGERAPVPPIALRLGAQPEPAAVAGTGRVADVGDVVALRAAMSAAMPGDVITLLPGTYRIGPSLDAARPGSAQAFITVRAGRPGSVILEQEGVAGFRVTAPYWRFENLSMRGVCGDDSICEHAFHVIGDAHHFAAVNNTLVDFNAHFKINGDGDHFPDHGLLDSNTLTNTHARRTANPVTPIDLVAASDWTIRRNLISDFVKDGGDGVSYGAFAKGGGARNLFEQNLVWCERRLQGLPGQRVGLSLGGGGTGKPYCRDHACVVEQQQGTLRSNLIAACSDVGIYLNSAAQSSVLHNSVVDTAGIDVRFPTSSADLEGNLVDGAIRSRNDGVLRLGDNRSAPVWEAFIGMHPGRSLFVDAATGDFRWRDGAPPARTGPHPDLCGTPQRQAVYGAFDNFAACLAAQP